MAGAGREGVGWGERVAGRGGGGGRVLSCCCFAPRLHWKKSDRVEGRGGGGG